MLKGLLIARLNILVKFYKEGFHGIVSLIFPSIVAVFFKVNYLCYLWPEWLEDGSILTMDSKEAFVTEDMQDGDILFELIITFLLVFVQDYFEKVF